MKALTKAIYGKLTGSALEAYIPGRLYKGRALPGTEYPYVEYGVATGDPEYTFSDTFENVVIQFDIYSAEAGSTQVEDIYTALTALYDDCALSPTSETLVHMRRSNYNLISEEHSTPTPNSFQQVWHYSIDYDILIQRTA